MRQKVFILYSLFFLLMCIVFSACSEADPDVISSTGYLILDYKDDHSSADIKLAAFAETKSDSHRAERLEIRCAENNYRWICCEPLIFSNETKQWAGYTEFCMPLNENFKPGFYELEYIDAQDKSVKSHFNISYDSAAFKSKAEEVSESIKINCRLYVAVYNESGVLLYYGIRKNSWKTDSLIFASVRNSDSYREYYVSNKDAFVYVMPPVYKNKQKNENTDSAKASMQFAKEP